jgi:polynucleotide 5'-kinase involved in rRNA processing
MRALDEAIREGLPCGQSPVILFMLGGVNVGKTYTLTALANLSYERGLRVAIVDADVGQSAIGPPCCIGLGVLERPIQQLADVPLHRLYFTGNTSPQGVTGDCIHGVTAAVDRAKAGNAEVILVDSTGWIAGESAKQFKLAKLEALQPSVIIAIAEENELAHILPHLTQRVILIAKSRNARVRLREERTRTRGAAYAAYFSAAEDREIPLTLLAWPAEAGTILGLYGGGAERSGSREAREREILGLAILRRVEYDRGIAVIHTPVALERGGERSLRWVKPGRVKLCCEGGRFGELPANQYLRSEPQPAEDTDKQGCGNDIRGGAGI